MLDWLIGLCGVLGFALSLFLAVIRFLESRVSIRIRSVFVVDDECNSSDHTIVRFVLGNLSSRPLAISSIDLLYSGRCIRSGFIFQRVLTHVNNSTGKRFELWTTRFPLNLAPYKAQEVVVVFRRRLNQSSRFHILQPGSHRLSVSLHLRVRSFRGRKDIRCKALHLTNKEIFALARRNNRL